MPVRPGRLALALVAVAAVALGVLLAAAGPAGAHPLGSFTVNRYARIEVSAGVVRIYYVLDEAEIPAFQERDAVAADPDRFLRERVDEIAAGLRLEVDDRRLDLRPINQSLDQLEGQGGLDTLRVAAVYEAALPSGAADQRHRLTFRDDNQPDRIGWREIVAVARGDATIEASTAPGRDLSDELRSYPGDLLQAPLDLRSATVTFTPGSEPVDALAVARSAPPPSRAGGRFAELITRQDIGPVALASMLGVAALIGAGHALLPGHGKTVMAAYLVGTKGRPVDAVLLGVIVSLMHTASVLVLGLVLFRVNEAVSLDRIYPALTAASGVAAIGLGAWLLRTRLRHLRATRAARSTVAAPVAAVPAVAMAGSVAATTDHHHHHGHEQDHRHSHDDGHGHGLGHAHGPGGHSHALPDDVAPLSRRGLVVLATSGGIVPSPTAVIVVVSAFALGRAALGLSLIAAFSVGLAATLTAVGLALVLGRRFLERRWPGRTLDRLPLVGAGALVVLGLGLVIQGLAELR